MSAAEAKSNLKTAPLRAMYATAISILLACPMRIANLSALDLDSTGIKVEGEGEWNARKHGGPALATMERLPPPEPC